MFRSLHIAATGMAAQETQLETISNNISNGNTVGYKKQRTDFQDLLYQTVRAAGSATGENTVSPTGLQLGSGVRVVSTSRVFSQGSILTTNNPLDVAIEGDGFFVVQQNDGKPAYTRAGALRTDPQGRVVTPEGMPLDPPVTIPQGATNVAIAANGKVTCTLPGETAPAEVGQIQTASFINPAGLQAIGHNLLVPSSASGDAQVGDPGTDGRGALLQGATEQSNVDIVEEMIGMISAQRAYEINSKVITTADDMLRAATQMR
ncbi:MAG TPA: flagellar basal-body rod protein FlgG [Polyangiaceae bacterium]|jgi:flagellar basal-body rod protein FlgG|nr:flagellar basal-body rod protein FlgG [Polyangiaceae bacterium]